MKIKQIILTLFYVASLYSLGEEQLRVLDLQNPEYPKATKHISQTNLSTSATNMYTIQQSGRHYVDTPLQAAPGGNNRNIIKITVSDVVLDLNGMTISQVHTNTATGLNAIDIASNLSNITITNGFINNVSDVGVNVGSSCNNIRLVNVGISNCNGGGAKFASTGNNIYLESVDITQCTGGGTSSFPTTNAATGLYMTTCKSFELKNCNFSYNQASGSGNGHGTYLNACESGRVTGCNFSSNNGQNCVGLYMLGNSKAIEIDNCQFKNNTSDSGNSAGLEISSCQGLVIKNSNALYNQNTGGTRCTGMFIGTSTACTVENCNSSYQISASGDTAEGFYVDGGTGVEFKNCNAHYNNSTAANAYGFRLDNSASGCIIDGCTAANNTATTSGDSYGIYVNSNVTNGIVTNNTLLNNVGDGNDFGYYDATASGTGTSTMLGGNVSFGHGTVGTLNDSANLSNTTGNYYFQLAGTISTTNSPNKMIQEIKIGQLAESGSGRIVTSGEVGTFGTWDNLSLIQ